jgi:folate-binding protein YgfZ
MIALFPKIPQKQSLRWSRVTLKGPDARDFLHRVTTVNTKTLAIGQGTSGCILSPQGKILSYFQLWYESDETFIFEFDSGPSQTWKAQLFSALDRLTFAEKMTLIDESLELASCWLFPEEMDLEQTDLHLSANTTHLITRESNTLRISHHGTRTYGRPWITCWAPLATLQPCLQAWLQELPSNLTEVSWETLEHWRILASSPCIDAEITTESSPLEVGLHKTIADNKGCYPGQEVIEKMISIGSPPRRLVQITGQGAGITPQTALFATNADSELGPEIGKITSISYDQAHFTALGLVKKMYAKVNLEVRVAISATGVIQSIVPFT